MQQTHAVFEQLAHYGSESSQVSQSLTLFGFARLTVDYSEDQKRQRIV